jgi:hypothetical protein
MIFYFAAMSCMVLVSETYVRSTYHDKPHGNDTVATFLYNLLGGFVAPISALSLLIWGFFVYRWWVPPLALFGCSYVMGMAFAKLMWDYSTLLVLGTFPLGIIFTVLAVFFR